MRRVLSLPQQSMVDANQFRPGAISERVTLSIALRVRGPLDLRMLGEAYDLLVRRHEVLRTRLVPRTGRVPAHGEVQAHRPVEITLENDGCSDAEAFARWDAATVDPDRPPLSRCFVLARSPDEHLVALILSHIVADPTGTRIAAADLAAAYNARLAGRALPPLDMQYGEYAAWQADRIASRAEGNRRAWQTRMAGLKPPRYRRSFAFKAGRNAAPVMTTSRLFDKTEVDGISTWSWRHRSTLSTTLLAAFAHAIRSEARGDDLVVSTVFEQRDHPAARHMLGLFLHPTMIRLSVDEDEPMPALVTKTRDVVLEAYRHAQTPLLDFLSMMPRFIPGGSGLEPSWFRFFQYVPMERAEYRFGPASARIAHLGGGADPRDLIGLQLGVFHAEDGSLHGKLSYDTNDLDAACAQRVLTDFRDHALEVVS